MKADLNLGLEITYLFFRRLSLVLACNHWTQMLVEKMIQFLGQSRELRAVRVLNTSGTHNSLKELTLQDDLSA